MIKPTVKTVYAALWGLLVILVFGVLLGSSFGFFAVNFSILIALLYDYFMSSKGIRFKLLRTGDGVWQQNVAGEMSFSIVNEGDFALKFVGVERLEIGRLAGDFEGFKGSVLPGQTLRVSYGLKPLRRGNHHLGDVMVSCTSQYGFWTYQHTISLPFDLKVYPNLTPLSAYNWQRLQNRKQLEALKILKIKSTGKEFDRLRDYIPGDDYRRVNWLASARHGYPVVNTYQMENNQRIYLMLDCGRSQRYVLNGIRQIDAAIETAVLLSHRITDTGDQFGITAFDQTIRAKLSCGRGLDWCKKGIELLYPIEASLNQGHYGHAYLNTMARENHRSVMMWFTDFEQKEDAKRFLNQLSKGLKKHVHVVLLMERPDYQRVVDAEYHPEQVFEKAVALDLLAQREQAAAYLRAHGVFVAVCSPESLPLAALRHYFMAKARLQGE